MAFVSGWLQQIVAFAERKSSLSEGVPADSVTHDFIAMTELALESPHGKDPRTSN